MRAISLTQPWATLVALGAKRIETRSWGTSYRGWIAIHASKGFPKDCQELCDDEPFRSHLRRAWGTGKWADALPRGMIIAVANLQEVGQIRQRADGSIMVGTANPPVTGEEPLFGDFTPGRFGWRFTNIHPLKEIVPAKGALGLWDVPEEVAARIWRQVPAIQEAHQ